MSGWTTALRPGLPLIHDGEQFTVAEIEGHRVLLRHSRSLRKAAGDASG
jgi:hypothetical protein